MLPEVDPLWDAFPAPNDATAGPPLLSRSSTTGKGLTFGQYAMIAIATFAILTFIDLLQAGLLSSPAADATSNPAPPPTAQLTPSPEDVQPVRSVAPASASRSTPSIGSRSGGLVAARRDFYSKLHASDWPNEPVPQPPEQLFRRVSYFSANGRLAALVTAPPTDRQRHPAIVWITGGDCNSIGNVWDAGPPENEQTASAYRQHGIVMMFPSLRGGNENPGKREGFLGEVDDVVAAAKYLSEQPYVDPQRVYLGGHSTGGTLALLVAESTDRFRAVFAFGPVGDVAGYDRSYLPFDTSNRREIELRSPINWLSGIRSPTFVFEGSQGNYTSLTKMSHIGQNSPARFIGVLGANHFNILAPTNDLIAQKILDDTGSSCNISFTDDEVRQQFRDRRRRGN